MGETVPGEPGKANKLRGGDIVTLPLPLDGTIATKGGHVLVAENKQPGETDADVLECVRVFSSAEELAKGRAILKKRKMEEARRNQAEADAHANIPGYGYVDASSELDVGRKLVLPGLEERKKKSGRA